MIRLHRLGGSEHEFDLNPDLVLTVESTPDTVVTLTTGAKLVVVQTIPELEAAINPNTAMMEMEYGDERVLKLKDAIAVCKRRGVPFFLDAAAMCPPFERLKMLADLGPDLFNVSGGKGMFGPQCSGVLFGTVPAFAASHASIAAVASERSAGRRVSRARQTLVAVEVALAVVLVAGAALFAQTLTHMTAVDQGFRPDSVVTMTVSLAEARYSDDRRVDVFYRALFDRLRALPGVRAAGAVHARQPIEVVITGTENDPQATALEAAANSVYRFGKAVLRVTPERLASPGSLAPALAETLPHLRADVAQALVCVGTSCRPPVSDPVALIKLLTETPASLSAR